MNHLPLIFLLACSLQIHAQSPAPDIRSVLATVDAYRGFSGDYSASLSISHFNKQKLEKESTFQIWIQKSHENSERSVLLKYLSPANERDNLILSKSTRLWVMNRRTSRPIPISNSQRLLGDASVGDIVNINLSGLYDGTIAPDSGMWLLDLKSIKTEAIYSRIQLQLEDKTWKPIKARFLTAGGKLIKTAYYVRYQKFAGTNIQTDIIIQDAINTEAVTKLSFSGFRAMPIPEAWFEKDNLSNLSIP